MAQLDSFKFPVEITSGSTRCTLGVKWYDSAFSYRIKVTDPSGNVLSPSATARLVSGKHPYTFYDIINPKPGRWVVEVFGNIRASKFRTIGFEVQPKIRFEVSAVKTYIKAGETIKLRAKLMYGFALPDVKIQANVRMPSGKIKIVKFYENKGTIGEKEEEKIYTASIKTNEAEQGHYGITVVAVYNKKGFNFKPDELYVNKPGSKVDFIKVKSPSIYRQRYLTIKASRTGGCDCDNKNPIMPGYNSKAVWIHPRQKELVKKWKERHSSK